MRIVTGTFLRRAIALAVLVGRGASTAGVPGHTGGGINKRGRGCGQKRDLIYLYGVWEKYEIDNPYSANLSSPNLFDRGAELAKFTACTSPAAALPMACTSAEVK